MSFLFGLICVTISFFLLVITFISIARIHAIRPGSNRVAWARLGRIYLFGSRYVTGQALRGRFGYPLVLMALVLYPVAFAVGQRFDGTGSTLHFLILSRVINILCQSCAWPGYAFCMDSLKLRYRSVLFALGCLLLLGLLVLNPISFFGYWPPFVTDYPLF